MTVCVILVVCGALAWILYVKEKLREYSVKAVVLKSFVSACFLAVAVSAWAAASRRGELQSMGAFVVLGLLFGLLGDVWLDLKYVFPEQDDAFTYTGFLVFGIGHILYMIGMLLRYFESGTLRYVLIPIALGILLGFLTGLLERPMKLRYGKMKPVVIAYGALLFSMTLLAGSLALLHRWQETTLNLLFVFGVLIAGK